MEEGRGRTECSASSYLAGREFKLLLALEDCFCGFSEELFHEMSDALPPGWLTLPWPPSFWWSIPRKEQLHLAGGHSPCGARGRHSCALGSRAIPVPRVWGPTSLPPKFPRWGQTPAPVSWLWGHLQVRLEEAVWQSSSSFSKGNLPYRFLPHLSS